MMSSSSSSATRTNAEIIPIDTNKIRKIISLSENSLLVGLRIDSSLYLNYEIWVNEAGNWRSTKTISCDLMRSLLKNDTCETEKKSFQSKNFIMNLVFKEQIKSGELLFTFYLNEEVEVIYLINPLTYQEYIVKTQIDQEYVAALNERQLACLQMRSESSTLFIYDFTTGKLDHQCGLTGGGNQKFLATRSWRVKVDDPKTCKLNTADHLVLWHNVILNKREVLEQKTVKLNSTSDVFHNGNTYSMLDKNDAITFGSCDRIDGHYISSNPRLCKTKETSHFCPLSISANKIFPLRNRCAAFVNVFTYEIEILDCSSIPRSLGSFRYTLGEIQSIHHLVNNVFLLQGVNKVEIWDLNRTKPTEIDTISLPYPIRRDVPHFIFMDGRIGIIETSGIRVITSKYMADIANEISTCLTKSFPRELINLIKEFTFFNVSTVKKITSSEFSPADDANCNPGSQLSPTTVR